MLDYFDKYDEKNGYLIYRNKIKKLVGVSCLNIEQYIKENIDSFLPDQKEKSSVATDFVKHNSKINGKLGALFAKTASLADQAIDSTVDSISVKSYIVPDIPDSILNAAIKSFAPDEEPDYILAVVSTSLVGFIDGIVFFSNRLYSRDENGEQFKINYDEIKSVDIKIADENHVVIFTLKDGLDSINFPFKVSSKLKEKEFVDFLNNIVTLVSEEDFDSDQEKQNISLEDMDDTVKLNYVKVLSNYCFVNDNEIDAQEYRELMSTIARIKVGHESRFLVREYNAQPNRQDINELLQKLKELIPRGNFDVVKKSLMKDLLVLCNVNGEMKSWRNDSFLKDFSEKIEIKPEQVEVIIDSIQNDKDIIEKRLNDTEIQKSMKGLISKAAGVGVPMLALYFSGTTGVSAIGMTTGLAALGGSGLAGFSSMFTGVGVVAFLGFSSYAVVKKFSGQKDLENNKQRERMLQEIIGNSQRTLNYLNEDMNYLAASLNEALVDVEKNKIKIKKIAQKIEKISISFKSESLNLDRSQVEKIITKLPATLNIERLNELTKAATREKARIFILKFYPNNQIKDGMSLEEAKTLYQLMDRIGYLKLFTSVTATAKAKTKTFVNDLVGENDETINK